MTMIVDFDMTLRARDANFPRAKVHVNVDKIDLRLLSHVPLLVIQISFR